MWSEFSYQLIDLRYFLAALLAANQDLVQAFTAYNQMMESHHLNRVTKVSEQESPNRNGDSLSNGQFSPTHDLMSFDDNDGAGVGHGHHSNGNGKGVSNDHRGAQSTANPFSDEPYFVAGPDDVTSAVKMGYVVL